MIASGALISIISLARSGATERAWQMFREAGLDRAVNDAAALSVKGRLLKDRAITARGAERRDYYRAAAEAYARAATLSGASYPLINAATLSLLGGNIAQSRKLAQAVLASGDDQSETAYWKAATRAEAHLLLGQIADAKVELARAIARAPRAYEDHASTLRQFGLILEALRADGKWLDSLRPPRCLHFAGSMGANSSSVIDDIRAFIARERVGFGFGALAAGADLLIAEALLAQGAELHVYLPGGIEAFRAASVSPYGGNWAKRFDAVLKKAAYIQSAGEDAGSIPGVQLAAEIAMGNAAMQARLFMTEAVQLLLLGTGGGPRASISRSIASVWKHSGRRQQVMTVAAKKISRRASPALSRKESGSLAATLCIRLDADAGQDALLRGIAKLLSRGEAPLLRPRWTGEAVLAAFASPDVVCRKALAIARMSGGDALRIGSHYSIVRTAPDPFGGPALLTSSSVRIPQDIAMSAPAGAIHVSESFAASLFAANARVPCVELVGELAPGLDSQPTKLFALRPSI